MSRSDPLVPGRIHGVRLWSVKLGRGSMTLCGINDSAWISGGEPTRAECRPYDSGYGHSKGEDHAPAPGCSCGLYSMHPWPDQVSEVASSLLRDGEGATIPVMGVVEAWGRIEVHEDGLRAQYARPRALIHFPQELPADYAEVLTVIARTYRVEVVEADDADSVIAYCAEHAPGMDRAAVNRLLAEPPSLAEEDTDDDLVPRGGGLGATPAAAKQPGLAARVGKAAINAVLVILALAWYGFWALVVLGIAGAILFGWFGEPDPPPPKPAAALRVIDQRLIRDGYESTYIAVLRNTSHRRAAVGVFPFGDFRDRHGHSRGGPNEPKNVELRPTIAPGATGVVYDDLGRSFGNATELDVEFSARMLLSRPAAFTVGPVHVNRRLCIVTSRARSDRPLDRSRVAVIGRDARGRLLGAGTSIVGPLPQGASTQVLWRLDPDDCAARAPAITAYPAPDPRQVLVRHGPRR